MVMHEKEKLENIGAQEAAKISLFGKTAKLVAEAKTQSHFQKALVKIGDYLIAVGLCLVAVVVLVALFRHESFAETLQYALVLTTVTAF